MIHSRQYRNAWTTPALCGNVILSTTVDALSNIRLVEMTIDRDHLHENQQNVCNSHFTCLPRPTAFQCCAHLFERGCYQPSPDLLTLTAIPVSVNLSSLRHLHQNKRASALLSALAAFEEDSFYAYRHHFQNRAASTYINQNLLPVHRLRWAPPTLMQGWVASHHTLKGR